MRAQLTKTETKLGKANEKAERWKREAAAARTAASRSDARVEKLRKKLDRASAALKPVRAVGPVEAVASGRPAAEPTAADGLTIPDQTWTVVQLRAEARARGLAGPVEQAQGEAARRVDPRRLSEPSPIIPWLDRHLGIETSPLDDLTAFRCRAG